MTDWYCAYPPYCSPDDPCSDLCGRVKGASNDAGHHHHVDRNTVVYHSHDLEDGHGLRVQETDSLGFNLSSTWVQHADECRSRSCPLRRYDG